ncbi:hypothetical protein [Castellaniella sp.]|uniref:hypothetical protein n=1 Tax=Castellaniella sp. TaxID=1955812 RepID=UPI003C785969
MVRAIAQQQLLNDEAGFDGLAEPDVVGNEQVDARHVDGTHQRVELEVFDADAAAERRLEEPTVGVGGRTPAHGIKEGVEDVRIVLPRDRRQPRALYDLGSRFDLPDDF